MNSTSVYIETYEILDILYKSSFLKERYQEVKVDDVLSLERNRVSGRHRGQVRAQNGCHFFMMLENSALQNVAIYHYIIVL